MSGVSRSGWREHQDAGDAFNALEGKRALLCQFAAPALAPREHLAVARLRLREASFGSGDVPVYVIRHAPDFVVGALQYFGQREFDVLGDALDLCEALRADPLRGTAEERFR